MKQEIVKMHDSFWPVSRASQSMRCASMLNKHSVVFGRLQAVSVCVDQLACSGDQKDADRALSEDKDAILCRGHACTARYHFTTECWQDTAKGILEIIPNMLISTTRWDPGPAKLGNNLQGACTIMTQADTI